MVNTTDFIASALRAGRPRLSISDVAAATGLGPTTGIR